MWGNSMSCGMGILGGDGRNPAWDVPNTKQHSVPSAHFPTTMDN